MTHLVQILLPLRDNAGEPFPRSAYAGVRDELTGRFGGVTAYVHSPAEGVWKEDGAVERDQIVVIEVMIDGLDRAWWHAYREELRRRFAQDELVVRAMDIQRL